MAEGDLKLGEGEAFSFRSGSWGGKAAAFAMVAALGGAVAWYWEPYATVVGFLGVLIFAGMALAAGLWWRVRVEPGRGGGQVRGRVVQLAMLLGVLPVWRRVHRAEQVRVVRLEGQRRHRRWHDLWHVRLIREDGRAVTLHWASVSHREEPTEAWELAQRIGRTLGVEVENKGIAYRR